MFSSLILLEVAMPFYSSDNTPSRNCWLSKEILVTRILLHFLSFSLIICKKKKKELVIIWLIFFCESSTGCRLHWTQICGSPNWCYLGRGNHEDFWFLYSTKILHRLCSGDDFLWHAISIFLGLFPWFQGDISWSLLTGLSCADLSTAKTH